MRERGHTLIELLAAIAIIGILAAFALPRLVEAIETARRGRAAHQIGILQRQVEYYRVRKNGDLPETWEEMGYGPIPKDPWDRPYVYTKHTALSLALIRTDGLIVPINKEYDIYSRGRDGLTTPDILDLISRDDVVRGRDGAFIGLAEDF